MTNNYKNFLRIFDRKVSSSVCHPPVLFEPLINENICEQLIWRRGKNLWDTPENYAETIISLQERTKSDVVIFDMRRFTDGENQILLNYISRNLSDNLKAVMLCETMNQHETAEKSNSVCAIGGFSKSVKPQNLPFIRMDGNIAEAISESANGYYAVSQAETVYEAYGDKIAILGGLGLDWLNGTNPTEVHQRCENLYKLTCNNHYAIGSGGFGGETDFLNFISLLSMYIRYR